ncbi:hypothetical protein CDL15_Pgr004082 [Punica granatum]|uniref:3-hydroxyisobutyryl-CoA hydrolase n=1 Tax=Punica granatum TaxID=22663 RepID=A0A218XFF5_PUNGR|nr:hypothetical protein CDL15_Pgr004082 [Punica granatum]
MASSSSSYPSGEDDDQVLVEEKAFVRTLTLNRTKQLNALSFHMISQLLDLFLAYEKGAAVKLIILKGKGRAFCAGGDVAAVVRDIREGIEHVFAMPETGLGLFPDIGASYFLSRLPGFFGEYVGLTGARMDGAEMLACGLATHFVPAKVASTDPAFISATIQEHSELPKLKEHSAYKRLDVIDRCFSRRTVEEIVSALEREATGRKDDWIFAAIESLKKASPTSLKITLRSIREGRLQGVGQCLIREYRMVCHVMRGQVSKDFVEGCRAILLDKDKNPKWEPSRLELVSDEMVDHYFTKVNDEEWEELKLPPRPSNLPSSAIAKL